MSTNPYKSPTATVDREQEPRLIAEKRLRISIVILLTAGLFNVAFFCKLSFGLPVFSMLFNIFINVGGTLIVGFLAWRFAMPAFELLTGYLHDQLSRGSSRVQWFLALNSTLMTTIPFAIAGAALWCIWVYLFYVTGVGFYRISVPIGICAHILAAGIYLPLVIRWWNIERDFRVNSSG
ncbi:MAG: hypothetical protein AAF870_03540 [Pseudomonadota bacterium]